jgi:hypothetical protein
LQEAFLPEPERRTSVRHRVFKGASIEFGGGAIDCTIRNRSDGGATLEVASPVGIPERFSLQIKGETSRKCRTVWRRDKRIGIAFC